MAGATERLAECTGCRSSNTLTTEHGVIAVADDESVMSQLAAFGLASAQLTRPALGSLVGD